MAHLHPRNGRSLGFNVIPHGLAMHPIPFRFLSLIALVSGIASQMTSDVSSQSHRSPASNPALHPHQHHHLQQQQHQHRSHGLTDLRSQQSIATHSPRVNVLESQRAEGHRLPPIHSDSILDMIDREQVGRILARKREEEKRADSEGSGEKRPRRVQTNGEKKSEGINRVGEGTEEDGGVRKTKGGAGGRFVWTKGKGESSKEGGSKEYGGEREAVFRRPRNKKPAARKAVDGHHKDRNGRHRVSLSQLSKRINDSSLMTFPLPNPPIPSSPDPFPPLLRESGDRILKSSKDALVVTRREYLRRDWCRTEPLVQRVKVDGCLSKSLVNGFCYGQCNSFYIPRSPNEQSSVSSKPFQRPDHFKPSSLSSPSSIPILYTPAFKSCAFCKPKEIAWTTLTLRCPALKPAQLMLRRRVERIKQCKCITEVFN